LYYASAVAQSTRLGAINKNDNQSVAEWLCDLVARSNEDMLFIYYYDDASGFIAGRVNTLNLSVPPLAGHTILAYYSAQRQLADFWYFADGRVQFRGTPPNLTQTTTFNHTVRPYSAPFRGATVHSSSSGGDPLQWSAPFVDFSKQFADFGLGGPIRNASTQTTLGILGVFYRTIAVRDYLATLKVAKHGRAFLIDPQTNVFLGSNAGDEAVRTESNGTVVLASPSDVQDGTSRRALDGVGWRLKACTSRCAYTLGSGLDALFVTIISVSDSFGLNLRVVVVVPAQDFLQSIRDSLVIGVGAAAGAICGVLVVSAFLLHFLLSPLRRLEHRLYESSTLQYQELPLDEEPSFLSEIFTIETAYRQLVAELKKVKSFLPQSVLRQLELQQRGDIGDSDEVGAVQDESRMHASSRRSDGVAAADSDDIMLSPAGSHERSTDAGLVEMGGHAPSRSTALVTLPSTSSSQHRPSSAGNETEFGNHSGTTSSQSHLQLTVLPSPLEGPPRSHSAVRSTQSGVVAASPLRKPPLHFDGVLKPRRVSLFMANMCSFHKAQQLLGVGELQTLHTVVTRCILNTVNAHQGVLELFHGDRFTASFNASLACHAPAERCCQTITTLLATLPSLEQRGYTGIRFGAATDMALCGNLGCDAMKRFSVVGTVVNQAFALMQQTKLESVQNLVCASTFDDAKRSFVLQHVNYVMLPQSPTGSIISTVICPRTSAPTLMPPVHMSSPVDQRPPAETFPHSQSTTTPFHPPPRPGHSQNYNNNSSSTSASGAAAVSPPSHVIRLVNDAFEAFAMGDIKKVKELFSQIPRDYSAGLARSLRAVEHLHQMEGSPR
jgi:class 3 adenylate cyclase